MNKDFWPMQPTFISDNMSEKYEFRQKNERKSSQLRFPNIHGILKADELRGFLADASDDIHINNPLSLFQVVPKSFQFEGNNRRMKEIKPQDIQDIFIKEILGERRIIRIDPGKLYSNFHCCDLFRKCNEGNNESLCYNSDSRIALLYHPDLESINIETEFNNYCEKLNVIIEDYNKQKGFSSDDFSLKLVRYNGLTASTLDNDFFYITYKCQYSNLEEFFFPIIFAGRVIAVLMQGQRFPKEMEREDVFKGNIENSRQGLKLKHSIDNLSTKYFSKSEDNLPLSNERLKAITNRILRLEEKICETVFAACQTYINTRFNNWQNKFRNIVHKEIDSDSDDALINFRKDLSQILKDIFEEFHDEGFIRIYTMQPTNEEDYYVQKSFKFELIGDSSCTQSPRYSTIKFSAFPIKKDAIEKEELLEYIKELPFGFNKDKDIFRMEAPLTNQKAYIIWKRYNRIYSGEQERHNKFYINTLKAFYPTLLEPFFILEGAKLEKKLEASMRISVHESAQVIPSVIGAINSTESLKILDEGGDYNGNPTITKPMHTILDVSNRLRLLEGLFRRSTLIFKNDPPKYEWHDFHRIVYSTKSLFDDKVYRKKYQALIIDGEGGFSKYRLFTDYAYLSHVLFNLIDNAVKYGRKGSNIFIKVVLEFDSFLISVLDKEEIKSVKISIISFGDKIIDRDKIFNLYYRKSSNEIEGMGIGLFLVKKMCSSMKYQVECLESKKISDINMPMHYSYRKCNDLSSVKISDECRRILKTNLSQNLEKLVVNKNVHKDWEVTELEIEKMINKPIYQNEFQITIPIKMNDNFKEI